MTDTHYLPGDRVFNDFGKPATVIQPRDLAEHGLKGPWVDLHIDDHPEANNYANTHIDNLKRQPIEPGCWVRELPGQNIWCNNGKPVQVTGVDGEFAQFKGFLGGTMHIGLHRIVRVAEPVIKAGDYVIFGVDVASGPDFTGFHIQTIGRGLRPDTLKQAQKLAETLHAKHFNQVPNIWKVADNMTDVLLQIDNMTAGMVRSANQAQAAKTYSNVTDFAHWLANMMNVPVDANECLNVARHMILEQRTKTKAIDRLAEFIMSEIPGEPSQSEGAVDTAIRIMKEQKKALQIAENARLDVVGERNDAYGAIHQAARRLAKWVKDAPAGYGTDESRVWLAKYAPEYVKPVFKRGDLVTWGVGVAPMGRIVGPGVLTDTLEVICLHEGCEGQFRDIYSSALRLIAC